MKIAAFIPARKNSKRIPHKNRLKIDNELIVNRVINNLKSSNVIDKIFLSTDDGFFNDKIPSDVEIIQRKGKFIDDHSSVIELLSWHQKNQLKDFDIIFQIFTHSILIDGVVIKNALDFSQSSDFERTISIAELPVPVEWTYKMNNSKLESIFPNGELIRSQDLGKSFYDAGQFYIYKKSWFNSSNSRSQNGYLLPRFHGVDLDYDEDINDLELLYKLTKFQK